MMNFNALMSGPFGEFNVTVVASDHQQAADYLEDQYEESSPLTIESDIDALAREKSIWESIQ
jgi:hypothetical protein